MPNHIVRDEIAARVKAFMESRNRFLLVKSAVGTGKTTNTLKALNDDGHNWIYLAPYHEVIKENLEFSTVANYTYYHLKSRALECVVPDYKRIAERYIDIRPICENHCPLRESGCPYYETKRMLFEEPGSWAGVHHHIPEFLPDFFEIWRENIKMSRYFDVLIIDENPIKVLFEIETANAEQLALLRDTIDVLSLDHKDLDKFNEFLNLLLSVYPGKTLLDYNQLYSLYSGINFSTFYDNYQENLVEYVRNHPSILDNPTTHIPKEYIKLWRRMSPYMNRQSMEDMIQKRRASPYTKKNYYFLFFDNNALSTNPLKTIGLDGTANQTIWESIIGHPASVFERVYIYNNIYQLREETRRGVPARYPLSSWVRRRQLTSSGEKLLILINEICKKKQKEKSRVLIISSTALNKYIRAGLECDNVQFAHYYYIRSRNVFYERNDTVILASEPNIQEFQLETFSRLSDWDRDVWRLVFTQEEMIQAVGRIREDLDYSPTGRRRNPREIYIFPYTTKTNEPEDLSPLFNEAKQFDYDNLLFFVKYGVTLEDKYGSLEDNIFDYIKLNEQDYVYEKDIIDEFKSDLYSKRQIKDTIDKLWDENKIDHTGKGYRIYKKN